MPKKSTRGPRVDPLVLLFSNLISASWCPPTLNLSFLFCKTKLTIPVLASQVRFLTEKEHLPNIRYV